MATTMNDYHKGLISRYQSFLKVVDDVNHEPVKVFDALSPKSIQELVLIREVSKELQKKKEEDRLAQLAKLNAVEEVAEVVVKEEEKETAEA